MLSKINIIQFFILIFLFGCNSINDKNGKPNIIFLLADDMRADAMSFAGNTAIKTPNIDKLAADGIVFRNAYVTTSICSSSRASILTGQYTRRHGVCGFSESITGKALENTYPLQLKQNGYNIGFIGKYGVGREMPNEYFDYRKGFRGQGTYFQKDSTGNDIYLTQKISGQIAEFVNTFGNSEIPFCLSVSFKAPHVEADHLENPFPYNEKYSELYKNDTIAFPATYYDYENKFPESFKNQNEARIRFNNRFAEMQKYQQSVKSYYRLIAGIDETIGELVDLLETKGLDQNTIIIFSSDNGFYLGEHGLAGKWYGHDVSIRVPMIIHHPNVAAKEIDEIALNIDLAPTILSMADIKPPSTMQGENLMNLMEGKPGWRNSFFYEHLFYVEPNPGWWVYIPQTEGIVSEKYKYMRYFSDNNSDSLIYQEVYNLEFDSVEKKNIAEHFLRTEKGEILLKRFEQLRTDAKLPIGCNQ